MEGSDPKNMKIQNNSEVMENAIDKVQRGASLRAIGRLFGIPRSTLWRLVRRYEEVDDVQTYDPNIGNRRIFSAGEELILADSIKAASKMQDGVSRMKVCKLALKRARLLNKRYPKLWDRRQAASFDWCRGFIKRHPDISLKSPRDGNLIRVVDLDKTSEVIPHRKNPVTAPKSGFSSNDSAISLKYPFTAPSITSAFILPASSTPQSTSSQSSALSPSVILISQTDVSAGAADDDNDDDDDDDDVAYDYIMPDVNSTVADPSATARADPHGSQVEVIKACDYVNVVSPRFSSKDPIKSREGSEHVTITNPSKNNSILKSGIRRDEYCSGSNVFDDDMSDNSINHFTDDGEVSFPKSRVESRKDYKNVYKYHSSSERQFVKRPVVYKYFSDMNEVVEKLVTLSAQQKTGDVDCMPEIESLENILREAKVIW